MMFRYLINLVLCVGLCLATLGGTGLSASADGDRMTIALKSRDANSIDPRFFTRDKNAVTIPDVSAWQHPAKQVFEKYKLKLTKVELMYDRKFPVFHVASLGGDPSSSAADPYLFPILFDILIANGKNAYKLVSDDYKDGFIIGWDKKLKALHEEVVVDDDNP